MNLLREKASFQTIYIQLIWHYFNNPKFEASAFAHSSKYFSLSTETSSSAVKASATNEPKLVWNKVTKK
jgi:hypothetical protein